MAAQVSPTPSLSGMASVTLQSIADEIGVSRTTVSNAYNRPDQLTPELRQRVLEAADRLGYSGPNLAARTLRTGRRNAVGLLFTEDLSYVFHDPDTLAFLSGVAETTAGVGTGLMLMPVPPGLHPSESPIPFAAVDGYIVYSVPSDHPVLDLLARARGPVVVVDEPDDTDVAGFVGIDDRSGAVMAAQHLVELGHRQIGIITGRLGVDPQPGPASRARRDSATVKVALNRLEGSMQPLIAAGIDQESVPVWEAERNDPDAGRTAASEMLVANPQITALLCFTDRIAIGACQAARRLGLTVPDDLSVVGFDDIPRATTWDPPLTTISQPLIDKGRIAAQMLLDVIDGAAPKRTVLPISLTVRSSTAVPRSAADSAN